MNTQKLGRNDLCLCGSGKKYKQCCSNARQASKGAADQLLPVAWNFYLQGLFDDAEKACRELLNDHGRSASAWHLLGSIALQQGQTTEAIAYTEQAIKLNGKQAEFFNNIGLAYHEQGLLTKAIQQYQRAILLNQHYADAYYNLHAALIQPDQLSAAVDALKHTLAIKPRDIEARFMLGMLLDYVGLEDEANGYLSGLDRVALLYRSRLDAWQYLKSKSTILPPVMGSAIQTFQHAFALASKQGLVLEFGVRFGNSIRMLAELAKQEVHGFDSFEGLPDVWHHEPKGSYTTKGVIPEVPDNVTLHVGWFDATLPKFLAENDGSVKLVNIDCDIYSSTKTVLELLAPRIIAGSIIIFDEYIGNEHWRDDEFKAFQEAVKTYGWQYEYISFSFFTKQVAVRITQV